MRRGWIGVWRGDSDGYRVGGVIRRRDDEADGGWRERFGWRDEVQGNWDARWWSWTRQNASIISVRTLRFDEAVDQKGCTREKALEIL
jgi:hypothetical protein